MYWFEVTFSLLDAHIPIRPETLWPQINEDHFEEVEEINAENYQ